MKKRSYGIIFSDCTIYVCKNNIIILANILNNNNLIIAIIDPSKPFDFYNYLKTNSAVMQNNKNNLLQYVDFAKNICEGDWNAAKDFLR